MFGERSVYDTVFGSDLPESTAIISDGVELSYPTLAELIDDAAAHLHADGLRQGQVVGLQLGNGADFAIAFHAAMKLGAVVTPVGTHLPDADRDLQLRVANAVRLVTAADMPALRTSRGGRAVPYADIAPDDLACLPFSSGTTGSPKAVMLQHRSLAANIEQFSAVLPLRAGETCLSVLPFSHIYGLTALLNVPLAMRARVVAQDFDRDSFLHAHEDFCVGLSFIAPPLATLLANDPHVAEIDFSALHTIVSGAAPLDVAAARRAEQRVGARIIQGFGLTESAPVTHLTQRDDTALESIGHPLPGTTVSVRDPDTLEPADVGEMWVRGPQVMAGYLGDPLATTRTLHDGWLRTGDLVRCNPDGTHTVIDRIKDVIKYHGFQVSPVKLEHLIARIPGVADVAVTRGFSTDGEEQPEAHVVLSPTAELTPERIMTIVAQQVAGYEKIRAVHLVAEIPRSASGKILRRLL